MKTTRFTEVELKKIARIQEERGITRKSAVRYFLRHNRGTKTPSPKAVDVKMVADSDKPEVKLPAKNASSVAKGAAYHVLAGRPSKDAVVACFGKTGYALPSVSRAERLGIAPQELCERFRTNAPARLANSARLHVEHGRPHLADYGNRSQRHYLSTSRGILTGMNTPTDAKKILGFMTTLLKTVEQIRAEAANRPREEKSQLGQFLTPAEVAQLVASLFQPLSSSAPVRLVDPGAGVGSLTVAFVNWLVQQEHRPVSVEIVAVELDDTLIPLLRETLKSCESLAQQAGIPLQAKAVQADFLELYNDEADLYGSTGILKDFTHAILNPPYRKINTDSRERELLSKHGIEVSNIYAGFVALTTILLADGGELSAITPRSFCNGTYFKDFRQKFFSLMTLQAAHVFVSRHKAFSQDAVLQENVIFSARKTKARPGSVSVRTSDGPESGRTENLVPYSTVLPPHDRDMVIHLPADEIGMRAMEFVMGLPARLETLGLTVSTGPVVDFRASQYLLDELDKRSVPLLYPTHFSKGGIEWPKPGRKPNAIIVSADTTWSLVPTGNYVLTKRFTSKEEKRRIVARVLEHDRFPHYKLVGLENHLNYFHASGRGLDADLSFGLAAFLNSTVVDVYFRQFNGHTQVNAGDLRMMRYPDAATLRQLGKVIQEDRTAMYDQQRVDDLVSRTIQTTLPRTA